MATQLHEESKMRLKSQEEEDISPLDELGLMVDSNNEKDSDQINTILYKILEYPSDKLTRNHVDAMRLGNFDVEGTEDNPVDHSQEEKKPCPCCGFTIQKDPIKLCTSMDEIRNIGKSTFLYIQTFKYLSIMLVVLFVIYGIYSMATNIQAAQQFNNPSPQSRYNTTDTHLYTTSYLRISLSSKMANPTDTNRLYYYISCWLGLATVLVWIVVLAGIKYIENKEAQELNEDTQSASDYSIVMEGCPLDVTQEELQRQFNSYYRALVESKNIPEVDRQPLTISKLNIGKPFYLLDQNIMDDDLQQLETDIKDTRQEIIDMLLQRQDSPRFTKPENERQALYKKYDQLKEKKIKMYTEQIEQVKKQLRRERGQTKTTVFVSFETNIATNLMIKYNEVTIYSRLRGICEEVNRFVFERQDILYTFEIERAPEPEDVLWTNIGRRDCTIYCRKFMTYTLTLVLLGASFAAVLGLTQAQDKNDTNAVLGFVISITIVIINVTLGQLIKFMTLFELDYTESHRQGSLVIKSVWAQMANSILIPVITSYYIKNLKNDYSEIYASGGLAENVFLLAVTNSFLPPLIILFDPYNIFMKVKRCLMSRPSSKLGQTQKEHNQLHQGIEFEVGYEYIYITNVFMFVCFFVTLQPIIPAIALLGYCFMYWAQKYCFFNRYRRPTPGTDFVNSAVYQIIYLGPVLFCLGNLTWANFDENGGPKRSLLPNLIALGFAALNYFVPVNTIIIGCCFEDVITKLTYYDKERIYFPSEYDRVNPATREEGLKDFSGYLDKKESQIKGLSDKERNNIFAKMFKGQQRGQLNQNAVHNQPNIAAGILGMGKRQQAFNNNQPHMKPAAGDFGSFFGQGMFGHQATSQALMNMFAGGGQRGPMPVRAQPGPAVNPYPQIGQQQPINPMAAMMGGPRAPAPPPPAPGPVNPFAAMMGGPPPPQGRQY